MREIAVGHVKKELSQADSQNTSQPLQTTQIGLTAMSDCNCQLATFQPTVLIATALSPPSPPEPGVITDSRIPEMGKGAGGWRGRSCSWAYHRTWLGSYAITILADQLSYVGEGTLANGSAYPFSRATMQHGPIMLTPLRSEMSDQADSRSESCGEEVYAPLHVLLRHIVMGAVVREEQVMDCSRRYTGYGLHTPTVEKVPVSSVGDADPRLLITVGIHYHTREHEAEKGGSQFAALLHSVDHSVGVKDHIGFSAVSAEATLAFREQALLYATVQTIEKDTGEALLGDDEQRDASVIITELPVPLPFVEKDDGCVFEILSNLSLAPHLLEEC
ncbi:unnamed protein product [Schistocephalus solidus]|uniref:Uncharacterized protein n=1 Tax=Schistocephalus solidus TaxID=70667 RepID=A0A183SG03_SCHSO|nr:unnamed protein product [Schistocephalus solidus]